MQEVLGNVVSGWVAISEDNSILGKGSMNLNLCYILIFLMRKLRPREVD